MNTSSATGMDSRAALLKRAGVALIALLTACMCMFALSGCSSEEKAAQEALEAEFQSVVDGSSEDLDSSTISEFESMGVNSDDFISLWLGDFSYDISNGAYNSDDETCTFDVTIKCRQVASAMGNAADEMINVAYKEAVKGSSDDETNKKVAEVMMDYLGKEELTETSLVVTMEKNGDAWELSYDSETAIQDAIVGDMDAAQDKVSDATEKLMKSVS